MSQTDWPKSSFLFGLIYVLGIGPKRAIDLIRQHRNIEEILKSIDTKVTQTLVLQDVGQWWI